MMLVAITAAQSVCPRPTNVCSTTGSVSFDSSFMKVSANMNSFQALMNEKVAQVARPGSASGSTIRAIACSRVAPSTSAASSSSDRDRLDEAAQDPDRQRHREGQVGDDQPRVAAEQPAPAHDDEQRDDQHHEREHLR